MITKLKKADECFYNNGRLILNNLEGIESAVNTLITSEIDVTASVRNNNGIESDGIAAGSLNEMLRDIIKATPITDDVYFNTETHVENGIFFQSSKEGFDFTSYDTDHNLISLRNQYIGSKGLYNGEELLINLNKKLRKRKNDWKNEIAAFPVPIYEDMPTEKNQLTVVGELQFGNWALVYRDLIRLLNADVNPGVDFYIYIAATGKLERLLSKQIVTYRQAKEVFEENLALLKTPTWLIGLDIE